MSSLRNTTVRRALHPAPSTKQLYCADVPVLFSGSSRAFVINASRFCKQSRVVNAAAHQQNDAEPGKPSPRSRHQSWPGNQRGADCHYAPSRKYQLPYIAAIVQEQALKEVKPQLVRFVAAKAEYGFANKSVPLYKMLCAPVTAVAGLVQPRILAVENVREMV